MKKATFFLIVSLFFACNTEQETPASANQTNEKAKARSYEKFEPEDGKIIVFAGQELEAVGGLDKYNDGYYDHFTPPAGFTMYTDLMTGSESFGFIHKGLDGLTSTDNWGDGDSNMSLQIADPDFKNSALAIGLDMKDDNEEDVAKGERDEMIITLGKWIKDLGDRPVFLRIGYEFDGHPWNGYNREDYLTSFKRIHDMFDSLGVENVAYVWQSRGRGSFREELDQWYPGDEYVDWCAFSFFAADNENHAMIKFARDHKKPCFMAEATPILADTAGVVTPIDLSKLEDVELAWKEWFIPFFRTMENNPDVIKAFSYINSRWKDRPMWKDNSFFKTIDARLHLNEEMKKRWSEEIAKDKYLNASIDLFRNLN